MRERPRLAAEVADVQHFDADFLARLARDRVFQSFAGLYESGQRGIPAFRPARLASKQHAALAVGDEHHDRWRYRRVRRAAALRTRARAFVFTLGGRRAAAPAISMVAVPLENLIRTSRERGE